MLNRMKRGLPLLVVLLGVGLLNVPAVLAVPLYNTGFQNVEGVLFTPQYSVNGVSYGPFGLSYAYMHSFDGTSFVRHIELDFMFGSHFTPGQQSAFRTTAEHNIERIWNDRAFVRDTGNQRVFPLRVDVTTVGPVFHQRVQVHPGAGRSDALNWYAGSLTPGVMAHEFGHHLGLYDEYLGGAVDRYPNPTLSSALMGTGALDTHPEMLPRYYQADLDFMNMLNPGGRFALVMAPEPSALLVLMSVLIAFVAWKMRQRVSDLIKHGS